MPQPTQSSAPSVCLSTLADALSALNAADNSLSPLERHRLCGLLYFAADDLTQAAHHFNQAAELDDEEMLSLYYLTRCQRGTPAITAKVQREILNRAIAYTKAGGMDEEPLYYIGHIFFFNGMLEGAVRCFGRCGSYLPALYMELAVMHHIDPQLDLRPHISFLLKEETRQTGQGPVGFLHPVSALNPSPETDWGHAIQHHAFAREIVDGMKLVDHWRQHA